MTVLTSTWSFVGLVLMFASVTGFGTVSQPHPKAFVVQAQTLPAAPYAHMKWVKLGELVPMNTGAEDVYVRLIAIEGEVLLAPSSSK